MKKFLCLIFLSFSFACEIGASLEKSIDLPSGRLEYFVEADWLPIEINEGKEKGSIFYVAYQVPSETPRPITFCFNGGPGSASVWIHMAGVGPRFIDVPPMQDFSLPTNISDNPFTLLQISDLVFVDAIYTGFSRPDSPTPASDFFSYTSDVLALSNFIDSFIQSHRLEQSPIYLLGCSYGTLRIMGLAQDLYDRLKRPVQGLIMLSTVLNYQSLLASPLQNETPYILLIPSYAVATWHYALGPSRNYSLQEWIKKAEDWAFNDYLKALMEGSTLSKEKKNSLADQMHDFIGLAPETIKERNLYVSSYYYLKQLLRDKDKIIGRFDMRYNGIDTDLARECGEEFDPSYSIMGTIAAGFQTYLKEELHFQSPLDCEYYFLGKAGQWSYVKDGTHYLALNKTMKDLLQKLPQLKVFVGSGIFDLATPFSVAKHDFSHLDLPLEELQRRVNHKMYEGGHMFYTDKHLLKQLFQDVQAVYK